MQAGVCFWRKAVRLRRSAPVCRAHCLRKDSLRSSGAAGRQVRRLHRDCRRLPAAAGASVQAVGAAVQPGLAEPGAGAQLRAVQRAAVRILLLRNSRRI